MIAYFVVLLFLGMGATFLMLSTNESRTSERQRLSAVAFHVAEAGVERALYDLTVDFNAASNATCWMDGVINSYSIGPDTTDYYEIPYSSTSLNGGSYTVKLLNVTGGDIWIQSTGTISGVTHQIDVYVRLINLSPWDNAIFAGAGASGSMINGNVDVRGSVHILGTDLVAGEYALDLGGTSEIVGNNYNGMPASLEALVPALDTVVINGETVETLGAELRVKNGLVGLSGSSQVGEVDASGNSEKETVDGIYVTTGWGGTAGSSQAYSDNGTANAYDLGDQVTFPSLSDTSVNLDSA